MRWRGGAAAAAPHAASRAQHRRVHVRPLKPSQPPPPAPPTHPHPPHPQVKPALDAIRALGPVLEDHLQLLLPALNRLIAPAGTGLPLGVQEEALAAMQDLLPRMQLAGFSSAVLHPLMRLLDGPSDELRERALDTLCSVSLAIGPDFAVFVPAVKKARARVWRAAEEAAAVAGGDAPAQAAQRRRKCRTAHLLPASRHLAARSQQPATAPTRRHARRSWRGTAWRRTPPLRAWPPACSRRSRPA